MINQPSKKGFTIVELLVVIVVIGILAAITIVSYIGISNKAKTTANQTNAQAIQSIVEAYNAENSQYPDQISAFTNFATAKLPAGLNLLTGSTTLNASNGQNSILWKYNISGGKVTGGTISYWDYTNNQISTNVIAVGDGIGTFQPNGSQHVKVLAVAGGGGGGAITGGGGGAGGVVYDANHTVSVGSYPIVIGSGGASGNQAGGNSSATNGGNSTFDNITALGGGAGGSGVSGSGISGFAGGSGGGSSAFANSGGVANQTNSGGGTGYGFSGGTGRNGTGGPGGNNGFSSGGGGGAGGVGGSGLAAVSGLGGVGVANSISGSSVYYGGGGGGGADTYRNPAGTVATGGNGGGGNGGNFNTQCTAGAANTGGGGGGADNIYSTTPACAGGSGVVIISYATDGSDGIMAASGGTITYSGGQTIHTFTASGTFTVLSLTNSLISYYKLDGNSTDMLGVNNGVDTSITYSSGLLNQAMTMPNTTTSVINISPTKTANLTISSWVKLSSQKSQSTIWEISDASRNLARFMIGTTWSGGLLTTQGGGNVGYVKTFNLGQWYNFVATYDGSNTKFYIDTNLVGTLPGSFITGSWFETHIGNSYANSSTVDGTIDEFGIWSRVLSQAEMTRLYNSGAGLLYSSF